MLPRVVITGIGVVSALGCGRDAFWSALCEGRTGIRSAGESRHLVASVSGFAPKEIISPRQLRRMDHLSRMVVASARMALDDARLRESPAPERIGIVVGSAFGNLSESLGHLQRLILHGPATVSPMLFPNTVMNAPASYASMELGATGANLTVSQLEISGEQAILLGADLVRAGRADIVLAGGGDELAEILPVVYRQAGALSSQRGGAEWASPYDAKRNGVVLGEGAAVLVLESAQHARARGAAAYAEIDAGVMYGLPSPPYEWPETAAAATPQLRAMLASAGDVKVDLICGAASSSRALDALELGLFADLCDGCAADVWLTSLKGATGELGAAGALTTAAAALALRDQVVPPLCHLREPEPGVPFRFAAPRAVRAPLRRALVSGIARGGSAAALSLRRA